jgi:hypothetical protein
LLCPAQALLWSLLPKIHQIKSRLQSLARARNTDFGALDVRLIVENSLRLDQAQDLQRLRLTLATHRPRLLVLDPYVRLQRADENDARQVSAILSALRELSRTFQAAVALVHHARKNAAELPGQALRGSGDFWAWGDSNLYVARRRDGLLLTVEHRSAPTPDPLSLNLVSDGAQGQDCLVHLEVRGTSSPHHSHSSAHPPTRAERHSLSQRILSHLAHSGPTRHRDLRKALQIRDKRLSEALRALEASGSVARTSHGWNLIPTP